jgi:hypothetical protein
VTLDEAITALYVREINCGCETFCQGVRRARRRRRSLSCGAPDARARGRAGPRRAAMPLPSVVS